MEEFIKHVRQRPGKPMYNILGNISNYDKLMVKNLNDIYKILNPQMKMEPIRINKNINSKAQRYYQKRKSRLHKM